MQVSGIDAFALHFLDRATRNVAGLVIRIVQDLYLKTIPWVVEQPDGIQQPPYDIALVEYRQLHRDARPFGGIRCARGCLVTVAEIQRDEQIAVQTVGAEQHQDNKIEGHESALQYVYKMSHRTN